MGCRMLTRRGGVRGGAGGGLRKKRTIIACFHAMPSSRSEPKTRMAMSMSRLSHAQGERLRAVTRHQDKRRLRLDQPMQMRERCAHVGGAVDEQMRDRMRRDVSADRLAQPATVGDKEQRSARRLHKQS